MFAPILRTYEELEEWSCVKDVVATNGCFDLLHRGHVEHIAQASKYGNSLVIGINGDESVRKLKGPTRPIMNQEDRARIVAAIRFVDAVFIFPEVRATNFLRTLKPDVYLKGGDYTIESLDPDEALALKECGAKIVILPRIGEYSTSRLLALQGQ